MGLGMMLVLEGLIYAGFPLRFWAVEHISGMIIGITLIWLVR